MEFKAIRGTQEGLTGLKERAKEKERAQVKDLK